MLRFISEDKTGKDHLTIFTKFTIFLIFLYIYYRHLKFVALHLFMCNWPCMVHHFPCFRVVLVDAPLSFAVLQSSACLLRCKELVRNLLLPDCLVCLFLFSFCSFAFSLLLLSFLTVFSLFFTPSSLLLSFSFLNQPVLPGLLSAIASRVVQKMLGSAE